MNAFQLSEWEAFDQLDPVSKEWRADFRMAYTAMLFMNVMIQIYGKEGTQLYVIDDFIPEWDEEERRMKVDRPRQTVEQMKDIMLGLAKSRKDDKRKRVAYKSLSAPVKRRK